MIGYIYKITNDVNDKVYIGLCTTTVEERFQQHKSDRVKRSCEKRPLYDAMNKYGIEHFHVETIEECDIDILNEREQYWIAYYNSYHYGYNATLGGEGKLLYDHQAILARLQECPYPVLVAEEFHCCIDIVRGIAKRNNIEIKNLSNERMKATQKMILALNKETEDIIAEFESTVKAAEWCANNGYCKNLNSGVRSHIAEAANGKRKSAYGFKWKYKQDI